MSTNYTERMLLGIPEVTDRLWDEPMEANFDRLERLAVGALLVCEHEYPSASTFVMVSAGTIQSLDGTLVSYAGTSSLGLPNNATTKLWLTDAGVLTTGTSYPTTSPIVRLATVVALAGVLTSIVDDRAFCVVSGAPDRWRTVSVSASATLQRIYRFVEANATGGVVALTLPTLASTDAGAVITVMKVDASANNVTVATANGTTITLATQFVAKTFVWNGSVWRAF